MNTYEKPQLVSLQNGNHQTSWYVGKTRLTIQLLRLSISPKYQMVVSGILHGSVSLFIKPGARSKDELFSATLL